MSGALQPLIASNRCLPDNFEVNLTTDGVIPSRHLLLLVQRGLVLGWHVWLRHARYKARHNSLKALKRRLAQKNMYALQTTYEQNTTVNESKVLNNMFGVKTSLTGAKASMVRREALLTLQRVVAIMYMAGIHHVVRYAVQVLRATYQRMRGTY
ncbi:hypothetical protein E2C01_045287 [Portunus trituberculatus]|uniref:Uncharacterized protein n=1 Tax=Portunus trituberculatus TaxID=210409 RepID=A0A5B7FXX8_PORTR|nr:hypothetical protein [Portunus trituberculatus]